MADMDVDVVEETNNATVSTTEDEIQLKLEQIDSSQRLDSEKQGDYLALLQNARNDDAAIKIKEQCIYRLAKIYTEQKQFGEVANLLKGNGDFFGAIPKARTAKIVRNMLNIVATVPDSLSIQVELCQDVIAWCKLEKRTFLRQRIEAKVSIILVVLFVIFFANCVTILDYL